MTEVRDASDPRAGDAAGAVLYPGEPGSFAEDAALAAFGPDAEARSVPSFADLVAALERGDAERGVLPIENVVFGTVRESYDLLADSSLAIVGEVIVPVRLCLAALPGERLDTIERVYSHIQALGQAEAFLRARPWSLLATTNTAGSGRMIRDRSERGSAAVLSPRAAERYGLEVLASDIQSEPRNRTRFLVLSRPDAGAGPSATGGAAHRDAAPDAGRGTTLLVAVRNEAGALHRVLGVLAAHGLNMSKLESRPSRSRAWEYVFWMDLDADLCEAEAAPALADLRAASASLRVMGCYDRAAEPV